MNTELLNFNRSQGKVPDIFYYQLNGKSATENYAEQKQNIFDSLSEPDEADEITFVFESKVK